MNYTREEKQGCALVRIEGPFTIYEAPALRELFLECFEKYRGLILDLESVTECDTAGIQILCSARATAEAGGKILLADRMSDAVVNALTAGGLTSEKVSRPEEGGTAK
ncbi:MAG: STAS domain-containing protein [Desulfococcaceae bacterium]